LVKIEKYGLQKEARHLKPRLRMILKTGGCACGTERAARAKKSI
jgi:hypothetical protein